MKQSILIISFNNLSQSFWSNQLNIQDSIVWLIKKPKTIATCLKRFNPDIIIVDTYFSQKENEENILKCFQELEKPALETTVFHFSSEFSASKEMTTSLKGVFQTVLSRKVINQINELINSDYQNDLTA